MRTQRAGNIRDRSPSIGGGFDVDVREYFEGALTFEEFIEASGNRGRSFRRNYEDAVIPEDMIEEFAAGVQDLGGVRMLVMSEAWCPDAAANIPPMVRFMERVASRVEEPVQMHHRFRDESPELNEMLRGEGFDRIPAILLADADYQKIGIWQERPAAAQVIVDEIKRLRERGEDSSGLARKLREGYQSGRLVRSALAEISSIMG